MTTKDDVAIRRKLRLIRKHVDELTHLIPSDDEIADTAGLVRENERAMQAYRLKLERSAATEMETIQPEQRTHTQGDRVDQGQFATKRAPVAQGKKYELVPKFKNVYTFNMPAIVIGIMEAHGDGDVAKTLWSLIQSGAVKMTTNITNLQKYADNMGITLKIENDATVTNDDGTDGAWVGKRREQDGVERVPIK